MGDVLLILPDVIAEENYLDALCTKGTVLRVNYIRAYSYSTPRVTSKGLGLATNELLLCTCSHLLISALST